MTALLASCVSQFSEHPVTTNTSREQTLELIERSVPSSAIDRAGWASDIYSGFTALAITPTPENICAVTSVIEQESGFSVDPVVADLPAIAWREIDARAEHARMPVIVVHEVLQLKSKTGRSYSDRINSARTEKDLSDIYEDFIGAVPLGNTLFSGLNPIRTRGPMQVSVAFAQRYAASASYPYPVKVSIADELFTRRGSLYFGIAHLLAYPAPYARYLYRFADYNAGQYASRNAAFQVAVSRLSGTSLIPDGSLLPDEVGTKEPGSTELAVRKLAMPLDVSDRAIDEALTQGKTEDFENTLLYRRVFQAAEKMEGRAVARALVPRIKLNGPKLTRTLTTDWYARRVEARFDRCLGR